MKSRTKSRPIENLVLSDDRVREKKPATHRSELQISTFINCFFKCQIMNESRKNVRRSFGCTKEAFRNATSNLEPGSCSVNVIDFQQSAKRCTLCKMYLETLGNN